MVYPTHTQGASMSDNPDLRATSSNTPATARAGQEGDADAASGERPVAVPAAAGADQPAGDAARPPVVTEDEVKLALRRVKDPELNLNVIDLGLIYAINVDGATVSVDMSLTSPGCPSGPEIMRDVEQQLRAMPGVEDVVVNLVWSPYWTPERIEPRVRA